MATNQWAKIALKNVNLMTKTAQKSAIAATQSVSFKTPVDKGTLINNWFTEINGISTKTTDAVDKSGNTRLTEALTESMRLKIGDSLSYVNNLPYVMRIEYNGYSLKAPQGMVRITALEWPQIVATVARGLNDK